jgi:hypothetical protein
MVVCSHRISFVNGGFCPPSGAVTPRLCYAWVVVPSSDCRDPLNVSVHAVCFVGCDCLSSLVPRLGSQIWLLVDYGSIFLFRLLLYVGQLVRYHRVG